MRSRRRIAPKVLYWSIKFNASSPYLCGFSDTFSIPHIICFLFLVTEDGSYFTKHFLFIIRPSTISVLVSVVKNAESENKFQDIKELILEFSSNNCSAIVKCQELLKNSSLRNELSFIKANYEFVSRTITKFETESMSLIESVDIITKFQTDIFKISGRIGNLIKKKN